MQAAGQQPAAPKACRDEVATEASGGGSMRFEARAGAGLRGAAFALTTKKEWKVESQRVQERRQLALQVVRGTCEPRRPVAGVACHLACERGACAPVREDQLRCRDALRVASKPRRKAAALDRVGSPAGSCAARSSSTGAPEFEGGRLGAPILRLHPADVRHAVQRGSAPRRGPRPGPRAYGDAPPAVAPCGPLRKKQCS